MTTSDSTLARYMELFAGRDDQYALGYPDTAKPWKQRYSLVAKPLTPDVVRVHLAGDAVHGLYCERDGMSKWFAIDFDAPKDANDQPIEGGYDIAFAEAQDWRQDLKRRGLFTYLERSRSGNGVHVWAFLDGWVDSRELGGLVLRLLKPEYTTVDKGKKYPPLKESANGILICFPYSGEAVEHGNSMFLEDGGAELTLEDFLDAVQVNAVGVLHRVASAISDSSAVKPARQLPAGSTSFAPQLKVTEFDGRPKILGTGIVKMLSPFGCNVMRQIWLQQDDARAVGEPEWHAFLLQLSAFKHGREAAHAIFRRHKRYWAPGCDTKFDHVSQNTPHGCAYIHENFGNKFKCQGCPMTAPYKRGYQTIQQLCGESPQELERAVYDKDLERIRRLDASDKPEGISSGIPGVDDVFRLVPADYVAIGALPSIGKCLVGTARIVDADTGEYVTVEEFVRSRRTGVFALDPANRQVQGRVGAYVDDGMKPVVRLSTASGRSVEVTRAHPLLTPSGWQSAGTLQLGDSIAVPARLQVDGRARLDENELVVLALMTADGCLNRLSYTKSDLALVELLRQALVPMNCTLRQDPSDPITYRIRSCGVRPHTLRVLLNRHGLSGLSKNKHIPAAIWSAPRHQLARFIGLLWSGDGFIGRTLAEFGVASERLARDVQHALLRLGIASRLSFKKNRGAGCWTVGIRDGATLAQFVATVPFVGRRDIQATASDRSRQSRLYWGGFEAARYPDAIRGLPALVKKPNGHWQYLVGPSGRVRLGPLRAVEDPRAKWLSSADVLWDEIVELEDVGERQVFDLCVPGYENFVANDIYLHNTALAVHMINTIAPEGVDVSLFSAESGPVSFHDRQLAHRANIDSYALKGMRAQNGEKKRLSQDEWRRLEEAKDWLNGLPIWENYTTTSPERIYDAVEAMLCKRRKPLTDAALVLFDYFQYAQGNEQGKAEEENVRLMRSSHALKSITKIVEHPLVVFAQLKREVEGSDDPSMTDFRGTARLEHDIDGGLIMTGERMPGRYAPRRVHCVKRREGVVGWKQDLLLEQATCRFEGPPTLQDSSGERLHPDPLEAGNGQFSLTKPTG